MFLGQYEHKIDPRGRVAIPARFRDELKAGLVLSQGFERCIIVYPLKTWQEMAEKLAALPMTRSRSRRMSRFIFSPAFSQELDGLGRVLLPAPLRQYAEIKDIVIIVGVNTCIEMWSKEHWDAEKALMDEQGWQIAEGMELRE
ncbi:MAG: division/cell wall cluster transcriptional repressor MraZ [Dehalococcoidia bacterium]|nr:MAG: division/cell wall cluster transcriptional repressor MraZ [Dehalococcoidia bacterium]